MKIMNTFPLRLFQSYNHIWDSKKGLSFQVRIWDYWYSSGSILEANISRAYEMVQYLQEDIKHNITTYQVTANFENHLLSIFPKESNIFGVYWHCPISVN